MKKIRSEFDGFWQINLCKLCWVLVSMCLEDGSVKGDQWGLEIDSRFSYSVLLALNILGRASDVDVNKIAEHVGKCRNFDGGFGTVPGAESHAGQSKFMAYKSIFDYPRIYWANVSMLLFQCKLTPCRRFPTCMLHRCQFWMTIFTKVLKNMNNFESRLWKHHFIFSGHALIWIIILFWVFCGIAALCLANRKDLIDAEAVCWWLAERQLPCGGLNGRPEKLQDVCYSWWVLSGLHALDRMNWIDKDALEAFILSCQVSTITDSTMMNILKMKKWATDHHQN